MKCNYFRFTGGVVKKTALAAVIGVCFCFNVTSASAEDEAMKKGYVAIKGGSFMPNRDSGDGTSSSTGGLVNFDSGFNFEVAAGSRMTENFAIEAGIGVYGTKLKDEVGNRLSSTAAVAAIPITFSAIAIVPLKKVDLYAGAGIGLYTAALATSTATRYGTIDTDYKSESFGYHVFCGIDLNLSSNVAIGAEYKYVNSEAEFTPDSDLYSDKLTMQIGGSMVNAGLKFRF
jgi:opacity protein-like surface antigen